MEARFTRRILGLVCLLIVFAGSFAAPLGDLPDLIFADDFEIKPAVCVPGQPDADGDGLLDLGCIEAFMPPDPASVATPIDPTVATDFPTANAFLYTGPEPVQRGVAPGTLQPYRLAVLRGRVADADSAPLPGVLVRVLGHPEFGYTYTRADGVFDLAVNGGGEITVDYRKTGFLRAQRRLRTPWKDWAWLPEAHLVPLDDAVTEIGLTPTGDQQMHRANAVSDADGTRRATVMIPAGTEANLVRADGNSVPLTTLHLRATEYTVGPNGPARMPASLPATSGYTYAVELSADEAITLDARSVQFTKPVALYFENFLGFPVGTHVPVGYYDFRLGSWIPSPDGRVIRVLGETGGFAELDLDGSNQPAGPAALAALGIDDAERHRLAQLYTPGQTLWRSTMTHLTPWDCNFPYGPPDDAEPPYVPDDKPDNPSPPDKPTDDDASEPEVGQDDDPEGCNKSGSIIDCSNSRLGETIDIAGSPHQLSYRSDRLFKTGPEYRTVRVPITGPKLPASLKRIRAVVNFGGTETTIVLDPPKTNYKHIFSWDGRDAYGRPWQGSLDVSVKVDYVYPVVYQATPQALEASFGQLSGYPISGNKSTREVIVSRAWSNDWGNNHRRLNLGTVDAKSAGLGGWLVSTHHVFDPNSQTVYFGNGTHRQLNALRNSAMAALKPYAPVVLPQGFTTWFYNDYWTIAPSGAIFYFDRTTSGDLDGDTKGRPQKIYVQRPGESQPTLVIANCSVPSGYCENGGQQPLWRGGSFIVAEDDDHLLLAAYQRVYRIELSTKTATKLVDDNACWFLNAVPFEGRVYLSCYGAVKDKILVVWPSGQVSLVAGGSTPPDNGVPAINALVPSIYEHQMAVTSNGDIFLTDFQGTKIYVIRTNGIMSLYAGGGGSATPVDGVTVRGGPLNSVRSLATWQDRLFVGTGSAGVREVSPSGQWRTLAGSGNINGLGPADDPEFPPGSAFQTRLVPEKMEVTADGTLVVDEGDGSHSPPRPIALTGNGSFHFLSKSSEYRIPSEDGSQLYVFDALGRHLKTIDTLTGAAIYTFHYESHSYLADIVDADGNKTLIERDASGNPLSIIGPDGAKTLLSLHPDGLLATVTSPAGQTWQLTYLPDLPGLLASFTRPGGGISTFEWDSDGRLLQDVGPMGGFTALQHERWASERADRGTHVTAEGRVGEAALTQPVSGSTYKSVLRSDGRTTSLTTLRDGRQSGASSTGESWEVSYAPDPRFGAAAMIPASVQFKASAGGLDYVSTTTFERFGTPAVPDADIGQIDLLETTTVNGRLSQRSYDSTSHTWTFTSPAGRSVTQSVDAQSRPLVTAVPGLAPVAHTYDARGRLHLVTAGDGNETRQWQLDYDAAGYLASMTDPLGREVHLVNDAVGRTTQQTLPDGRTIHFDYDPNNNVTAVTPPERPAHGFTYDLADRLTAYQPPVVPGAAAPQTYAHNLDNDLVGSTDADGNAVAVAFLPGSPLRSSITAPGESRSFAYDAAARPTQLASDSGVTLAFDWLGTRPLAQTWSGPVAGRVARRYDRTPQGISNFWLAGITLRIGNTDYPTDYAYDNDGLLTGASANGQTLTLARDAQNGMLSGTGVAAITDSWTTNLFAEPTGYVAKVNGAPVCETSFVRDKLGRITQKTETTNGQTHTDVYGYDLAGRLESITRDGSLLVSYSYDGNSNRLSATTENGTVDGTVDAQDRLTAYGSETFVYNATGQLSGRTDTDTNETTLYQYDVYGNLKHVLLPNGTNLDYVIDGLNRRIGKKQNGQLQQGWLYANQLEPIAELDGLGNLVSRFVYADRKNVPSLMIKGGKTYRIIADHLGSPRLVIDVQSGEIVQRMDYDVWGKVTLDTNPGFQPFGFAGGLYDRDTGLVRFGARDYDPAVGRWTAKDPIGFKGNDSNLYSYAYSDPVNWTDVTGLMVQVCRDNSTIFSENGTPFIHHYWIKTDTQEAGMGTADQGADAGNQYEFIGTPTEVLNHKGRSEGPTAECRVSNGANEDIVNSLIKEHTPTGPFVPPINFCQSFVRDVIEQAQGEFPFDPPKNTSKWPESWERQ